MLAKGWLLWRIYFRAGRFPTAWNALRTVGPVASSRFGALHAAYPRIDGLRYCSSMAANAPTFALYERARLALPARPIVHRALADPSILTVVSNAARQFGYALV